MNVKDLRAFLIEWNATFPLDKKFRERRGILFNSKEHREVCQIDVYLEYLENEIHNEILKEAIEDYEKEQELKKGRLTRERKIDTEAEQELFDNFDIDKIDFDNIQIG